MALFCAAIGIYLVSLKSFLFHSHVQVFSCDFLCLQFKTSIQLLFFPPHTHTLFFCFPVIAVLLILCCFCWCLWLVFLLLFYVVFKTFYRCIDAIFNALSPPFLYPYSPSMSSQECKASCFVTGFLVLLSTCWSSSFNYFMKDSEYLTRRTAEVFFPWWDFCYIAWFRFVFSFSCDTLFIFFSFISACLIVSACNIHKYLKFSFSASVLIFLHLVVPFLPSFVFSTSYYKHDTFSMLNSMPISWLYILTAFKRVFNSFSFLANSLMSSTYIRWLIFYYYYYYYYRFF